MKKFTKSSLHFSIITEENAIQTYSLDAYQTAQVQNLMYTNGSFYVFQNTDSRVINEILKAERTGDDLIVAFHNQNTGQPVLKIVNFFANDDSQIHQSTRDGEVIRLLIAQDHPQQGPVVFETVNLHKVEQQPQPALVMLNKAIFSTESEDLDIVPLNHSLSVGPAAPMIQSSSVEPVPPPIMMTTLYPADPPKITHAVDQLGARQGFLSNGSVTDDKLAVLEGTGTAGSVLEILDNGTVIGEVLVDANGNWHFEPEARFAESGHVFVARDKNSGDSSDNFALIVDSVAPSRAIIDSVMNDQPGGGLVGTGQHTSDNTPIISGRAEALSVVAIYNGKSLIGTSFSDPSGVWSFSSPFTFPDGEYTLTAKAIDFSGNTGLASSAYKITIDTIPPATPFILYATDNVGPMQDLLVSGDLTDDRTPTFSGKAEAGTTLFMYDGNNLLGTTGVDANGNWSFTPPFTLKDGEHHFNATVRDKAGNLSTKCDDFMLFLGEDRTSTPTIDNIIDNEGTIQGILSSGATSDDATPTLHGKAQANDAIKIFDNGIVIGEVIADSEGKWHFTPDSDLAEGKHAFQVQAIDSTHSPSMLSPTFEMILSLTPPDISNLFITGVYDDSGSITGNVASGERTDDRTPTITGTGPAGESVIIYVTEAGGQRELGRTNVSSNGTWMLGTDTELNYGLNIFTVVTVNSVGQISQESPGYSIAITTSGNDIVGGFDNNHTQNYVTINSQTDGDQYAPRVTKLANGNLAVVWTQYGPTGFGGDRINNLVMMQLMDSTGTQKIGSVQQVNQSTLSLNRYPEVASLEDGSFMVTWFGAGIQARRYDPDGVAQGDSFLVNQTPALSTLSPSILALPDGGYILCWRTETNQNKLVQRTFDSNNKPVTDEVVIGDYSGANANTPTMVLLENGWYLTTWGLDDIYGQVRKIDGSVSGPSFLLGSVHDKSQAHPNTVVLKDGSFIMLWDTNDARTSGSSKIAAIHYSIDPDSGKIIPQGTEFLVDSYSGIQHHPVGIALDDGGYIVFWVENVIGGAKIVAQRFDANSQTVGQVFNVDPSAGKGGGLSIGETNVLDAVLLDNGEVFVTWNSDTIDGSGLGIKSSVVNVNTGSYYEFMVNSNTTNSQKYSSITSLPDGGYIMVWQSNHSGASQDDIMGKIYDATGQSIGQEFKINTSSTVGVQSKPNIITLNDGTLVVSYQSTVNGNEVLYTQHMSYTYDNAGKISGVIQNSTGFSTKLTINSFNVEMSALDNGGYVLVWQEQLGQRLGYIPTVEMAQFYSDGTLVPGSRQTVSAMGITIYDGLPSTSNTAVATLDDGNVAVAYTRDTTGEDIYLKIYDTTSQTLSSDILVNQNTLGYQGTPCITKLNNGNVVVSWVSKFVSGSLEKDTYGWGIVGRIFTPQGKPVGDQFVVNTLTIGDQTQPSILTRPQGGFVVVYLSEAETVMNGNIPNNDIYAQYFNDAGHRVGQEIHINQSVNMVNKQPTASFLEDGRLVVSWTDNNASTYSDIKSRIIDIDSTLGLNAPKDAVASQMVEAISQADSAKYGSLWMLFDDGSESGLLLSSESLTSVRGGSGNDTIGLISTTFTAIDGGKGIDTLLLDGKNMSLDLDTLIDRITGIEKINLGQGNANSLSLSAGTLDSLGQTNMVNTDGKNQFIISGDSTNNLHLVDTHEDIWQESGNTKIDGVVYNTYLAGTTELYVEHSIHVTMI